MSDRWKHAHHTSCFDGCEKLEPRPDRVRRAIEFWNDDHDIDTLRAAAAAWLQVLCTACGGARYEHGYGPGDGGGCSGRYEPPPTGLCDKHDIDPAWDECPCCRVEMLEMTLEERGQDLPLALALIRADLARYSEMAHPAQDAKSAFLTGMRQALLLVEGLHLSTGPLAEPAKEG